MASLFVSDLHLCPTREAAARQFLDFLAGPARAAEALYILGDLFDYWVGDDDLDEPFNARVCEALAELSTHVPACFIAGNRDFLTGEAFAAATGLRRIEEPHRVDIQGTPTLLLHGDLLCTDDTDYQRFRLEVRSPAWREAFLGLPLAERRRRIEALRSRSEQEKQRKSAAIMDVNEDALAALLRRHGYPRVIHGHTHRPAHHRHALDGRVCERFVLADWYEGGSYLACDAKGCRALTLSSDSSR